MGFLSPLVTFLGWLIGSFVDFFTQRLYTSKIVFNRTYLLDLHRFLPRDAVGTWLKGETWL